MPLRTIARCLRGMAPQVRVGVGQQGLAKRDVQGPGAASRRASAHDCEARDARHQVSARARRPHRSTRPRRARRQRRAAVHAERQRHQRMAEQTAAHFGERQHAAHDVARVPRSGSDTGGAARRRECAASRRGERTSRRRNARRNASQRAASAGAYAPHANRRQCRGRCGHAGFQLFHPSAPPNAGRRGRRGPSESRATAASGAAPSGAGSGSGESASSRRRHRRAAARDRAPTDGNRTSPAAGRAR